MSPRVNVIIGVTNDEVSLFQQEYPQFRKHVAMTPRRLLSNVRVGEYVWTPNAQQLPARLRMRLRGALAPLIDERSVEETFPDTLLSW